MTTERDIDILLVDDDDELRDTMTRFLTRLGYRVEDAAGADQAIEATQRKQFNVAFLDMVMPGLNGLELLERMKNTNPDCEVIVLTGEGTIETAVQAMKLGAYDYLTKPIPLKSLDALILKAKERHQLRAENTRLKMLLDRAEPRREMIGDSDVMKDVFRLIERAGPSDKAILIQGESGTGKELVARALHRCSTRVNNPMVTINCAALPEALLESELFGHEKGAFTGAVSAKPGLFEVADESTLFIDEIGELPGSLQAKMLRVLEDGSLRRVGSIKERKVNVRILAATNRDMTEEVAHGRFREDLFYRINVMSLELPPLRKRQGDIPLLVNHFLGSDWDIAPDAMRMLESYDWPGNIRQLANAIERAKILADDWHIRMQDLPRELADNARSCIDELAQSDDLSSIERAKIIEVLRRENGNKSRAARTLGIDRRKLYRLVEKYSIE